MVFFFLRPSGAAAASEAGASTCPGGKLWPSCKVADVVGVVVMVEGWGCGLGAKLGPDKTGPALEAEVAIEGRGWVGTTGVEKVADWEAMEGSTVSCSRPENRSAGSGKDPELHSKASKPSEDKLVTASTLQSSQLCVEHVLYYCICCTCSWTAWPQRCVVS